MRQVLQLNCVVLHDTKVLQSLYKKITASHCLITECRAHAFGGLFHGSFSIAGTWNQLAKLELKLQKWLAEHAQASQYSRVPCDIVAEKQDTTKTPARLYQLQFSACPTTKILHQLFGLLFAQAANLLEIATLNYFDQFSAEPMRQYRLMVLIEAKSATLLRDAFIELCEQEQVEGLIELYRP